MFICQYVYFGGEKDREKMRKREREGWINRVKIFE